MKIKPLRYCVKYDSLIIYPEPERVKGDIRRFKSANYTSGNVTHNMMRVADVFMQVITARGNPKRRFLPCSFLTLTIPRTIPVPVTEANSCLNEYLKHLRRLGLKNYIWKLELQERGQIHYHLLLDTYTDYNKLLWAWNSKMRNRGWLTEWVKKRKNYNPPSVWVKGVKSGKMLQNYLLKYVCKTTDKKVKGRIWDATKKLKQTKLFGDELDSEQEDKLLYFIRKKKVKVVNTEFLSILPSNRPVGLLTISNQFSYNQFISKF